MKIMLGITVMLLALDCVVGKNARKKSMVSETSCPLNIAGDCNIIYGHHRKHFRSDSGATRSVHSVHSAYSAYMENCTESGHSDCYVGIPDGAHIGPDRPSFAVGSTAHGISAFDGNHVGRTARLDSRGTADCPFQDICNCSGIWITNLYTFTPPYAVFACDNDVSTEDLNSLSTDNCSINYTAEVRILGRSDMDNVTVCFSNPVMIEYEQDYTDGYTAWYSDYAAGMTAVFGLLVLVSFVWYARVSLMGGAQNALCVSLATLHFVAGIIHIASALVLLWLTASEEIVWEAPATLSYVVWQNTTSGTCAEAGACYTRLQSDFLRDIPVIAIAVLFGVVSGTAHLLFFMFGGASMICNHAERGYSWIRWADYSVSASLMILVVAALSNVSDVLLLVAAVVFQFTLLGVTPSVEAVLAESVFEPRGKKSRVMRSRALSQFFVLCFGYVFGVWVPIITTFYMSVSNAPADVPEWVNAVIWIIFIVYTSFIVVFLRFLVFPPTTRSTTEVKRNMILQELYYICLSLVSKVALHWTLYTGLSSRGGVLFTSEDDAMAGLPGSRTGRDAGKVTRDVLIAAFSVLISGVIFFVFQRWRILRLFDKTSARSSVSGEPGVRESLL